MKHATILGLAIGDALGQPFEFSNPKQIIASNWTGNFVNRNKKSPRKPGQWTDDTIMALCIANSLIENKGFNPEDIVKRYVEWFHTGDLRGIGMRCESAIRKLIAGDHFTMSGKRPNQLSKPIIKTVGKGIFKDYVGNGTVMRVAPIGVAFRKDFVKMKEAAHVEANITHHHQDARDSSLALASIIANILEGASFEDALFTTMDLKFEYNHVPLMMLKAYEIYTQANPFEAAAEMGSSGTAHQTLGTAIYAVLKESEHFHNSLVTSIIMGGDTDTRAAIVGAIVGAAHPEQIPKELIEQVEDSELLQKIDSDLYNLF